MQIQGKVDISLIICTRNRAKLLDPFLAALENVQCEKSYEIIVVDNGSTDDTLSKRRRTLAGVGGFDPMFGAGTPFPCEDCDVAGRISSTGWAGAYVPSVVVSHHHRRKEADRDSLMCGYDRGRGAYHTKMLMLGNRKHGWKGWTGLSERSRWRRASAFWEFVGSLHYLIAIVARAISWASQISAPRKINPHPYSSSQIPVDRE